MSSVVSAAIRYLGVFALLLTSGSCAGMGTLADVLATTGGVSGNNRELSGEIRSIDTRRQELQIQTVWGRSDRVQYDGRTDVIYQQRRYSVRDLERGDVVRVLVDNRGRDLYASRIQVQQSVRDRQARGGVNPRVERFEGSVVRIDTRQGWFELQQNRGPVVLVVLPYNPSRAVDDRFRRLSRGNRVRIEGYIVNGSRIELRRFM
jgi:hypothetical protein